MGHIVIHHRCRSRLVGGAEALSDASRHIATVYRCFNLTRSQTLRSSQMLIVGAAAQSLRHRDCAAPPVQPRRFGAESANIPWLGECRSAQKKTSRRDWFRRKAAARYDWHTLRNNPTKRNTARRRSSVENSILGAVRPPRAADGPSPCDTPQSQGQRSQGATLPTWTALGR